MLTHLIRNRPAVGFPVALLIGAFVTLVGVGGALSARDSSPGTAVFLGFVGAVGALVEISFVLEIVQRSRRPRVVLGADSEGRAATVLPFGPAALVASVGVVVAALVAAVAGLLVAQDAGSTGWLAICAVVAVGSAVLLVPVLLGRVRSGQVSLTADGVEHRRSGTSWRLAWDDLEGATPSDPLAVLPRPGATVTRRRFSPYAWNGDVRSRSDVLGIGVRHLSVDEKTLLFLLASYQQHPELRSQLGTQQSLDWRVLDAQT